MMKHVNQMAPTMASLLVMAALTGCTIDGGRSGTGMTDRGTGTYGTIDRGMGGTSTVTATPAAAPAAAPVRASAPAAAPAAAPAPAAAVSAPAARPAAAPVASMGASNVVYYPTGHRENAALMVERMCPAEVVAGVPFEYTLKVTNVAPVGLENVMLTETIPAGFSLSGSQPNATSTAGGVATFNLGSLAAGESKTVKVMGSAGKEGRIASCATVSYTLPVCCTINVVAPSLKIQKFVNTNQQSAEFSQCDTIPFRIIVTNSGTGTASNVVVRDTLPAGLTLADGKTAFEQNIGNLAGGESRTIDLATKATRTGSFQNNASAMADGNLKADSNNVTALVKNCNLQITKKARNAQLFAGRPAVFIIEVANTGDGVAKNVVVEDMLPAGASFVSATEGGRGAGNSVTWNLGDMAAGARKTLEVTANPGNLTSVRNVASIKSQCCPSAQAEATINYEGLPAIVVELIDEPDPLQVGESTTFTIKVRNQGIKTDTNLKLAFTLANGLQFVSGQGSSPVSAAGQVVTLGSIAQLAPKQEVTWTVVAKCTAGNGDSRSNLSVTTDYFKTPITEIESTNLVP